MKKYKLAIFDIDGILNEHGGVIIHQSIEAINKLKERGIQIAYASGKNIMYLMGGLVFSGFLEEDTIIIGENGGVIFNPNSKHTHHLVVELDKIRKVKQVFYSKCVYKDGFYFFKGKAVWEEPKDTLFTIFPRDVNEFPIEELSKEIKSILIENNFDDDLYISEHSDAIDIVKEGINKAKAIEILCRLKKIKPDETIAFGDDFNDYQMLDYVGFPICVENARDKIKELVNSKNGYISKKRCGEGVLEAVNMLINKGLV